MADRNGMQTRVCQKAEFRAANADGKKKICGYFAVFNENYEIWKGAIESIDPHAFDNAIEGKDIRALIDHKTELVLGRTTAGTLTLRVDAHGLYGEIDINEKDTDAMNLYARVERGDVNQCSFAFDITDEEEEYNEHTGTIHWTIKAVDLYEVSCCTFPAYTGTSIEARRADFETIKKRSVAAWKEKMKARLK